MIQNASDAIVESKRLDGIIQISIFKEQDMIVTKITDNGIGIQKKQLKQIFIPFSTTKKMGSSWGLGLSYVLKAVKAHHGFVLASSVPDVGTTFEILLQNAERGEKNGRN